MAAFWGWRRVFKSDTRKLLVTGQLMTGLSCVKKWSETQSGIRNPPRWIRKNNGSVLTQRNRHHSRFHFALHVPPVVWKKSHSPR